MNDPRFIPILKPIDEELSSHDFNNPFSTEVPVIVRRVAKYLQTHIAKYEASWRHDFGLKAPTGDVRKGKMFGVLVVENENGEWGYLSGFSGKLDGQDGISVFVPSVFDDTTDDYFIHKGMKSLTEISQEIKTFARTGNTEKVAELKEIRRNKSTKLQQKLFENYRFLNANGTSADLCGIFARTPYKKPPAGAGECAAPKLLNYAFNNHLKPIAIGEFWWGASPKSEEREHLKFYPACKNKCRPILEFMLQDETLFNNK